jgi:flavin-dependent dehydrogenase
MLLARKGYRVLLLDKTNFPSDTMSSLIIWPRGIACLKRWGLLDALLATGVPPVTRRQIFDVGPFALTGSASPFDDVSYGYAPRRTLLDKLLVDAAAAAGAEVLEGFSVKGLIWDNDTVTGVYIRSKDGKVFRVNARIVIGADGFHSKIASWVKPQEYNRRPTLSAAYYTYYSDLPADGVEFYVRPGCGFGLIPTNNNLTLIIAGRPVAEFREYRSNIEENFLAILAKAPVVRERVAAAKRAERFVGTANMPGFFRKPYGSGWALAGDAGYHKDSITAQGISDAFCQAELLAEALDNGFSGMKNMEAALADYEKQRNESVLPMYEFTCQLAALEPPPKEIQQLFDALRGNQPDTDKFFGMLAGSVPIPEFFAPGNIQRIMSGNSAAADI